MDLFRIVLFSGLVLHKVVWQWLKRTNALSLRKTDSASISIRLIKLAKVLALGFLLVQTLLLDLFPIAKQPYALRAWGIGIYLLGLAIALSARVQLGKNWADIEDYRILPKQSLTTSGIYRFIRHPIYTGDILLFIGLQLALNSWLVLAVVIPLAAAVNQAVAEEVLLAKVFPAYSAYCRRTKRFIPFIT